MKKNKFFFGFFTFLFAASFIYLIAFHLKLGKFAVQTADLTLSRIKSFAVSPIFYFSFAIIIGMLVLAWAGKPVAKKIKTLSIAGAVVLEAVYIAIVAVSLAGKIPIYPLIAFAVTHPVIHLIPGTLLSIGAFKD